MYPDKQPTTLQRSVPPSTPNPVPGPRGRRLIPEKRDLTIEVPWLPENRFHYWIPENIAGTAIYEHEPWTLDSATNELGYQYRNKTMSFQVAVTPGPDELSINIDVENMSHETWVDRFINCCFGLWDAPDLAEDKMMQRTFVRQDGQLRSLYKINPWAGAEFLKTFYPLQNHQHHPCWQIQTSIRKLCPRPVEEGIMMTSSIDDQFTVSVAFSPPVLCVFSSTDSAFACIHAMPLISHLKHGQCMRVTGKVYFERGGPEACWQRYNSDLQLWTS